MLTPLQPDQPMPSVRPFSGSTAAAKPTLAADSRETAPIGGMPAAARKRAEALTSLFENDTPTLQYGYAQDLHDGRGITAGRAGFCSGTHDMAEVVRRYVAKVPENVLAPYMPALDELDRGARKPDDTSQLQGLEAAWAKAAKDPAFRQAQDEVVERTYFLPAMALADRVGLESALGRAIFYDTIIQHGDGSDPDGLPALIARTNARVGKVDEAAWLKAFLAERRADLAFANDPATREVWRFSVGRVDALASLLAAGNLDLHGPIRLKAGGYDVTIP